MTNKEKVYSYLRSKGLPLATVCGIMANIQRESSFNPTAKGDSGTSYGLCQWHKGRWTALKNYCVSNGKNVDTIEAQLDFMLFEIEKSYKALKNVLYGVNSKEAAGNVAYIMCTKYEIPANKETKGNQRAEIAKELFDEFYTYDDPAPTDTIKVGLIQIRNIVEDMLTSMGD